MSTEITTHDKSLRQRILYEMRHGIFAQEVRLPRENVLAEKMGISRTQLRDILASLEREGFITRRHGVGTIINRHVLNVTSRMDLEIEFMDMVAASGKTPGLSFVCATPSLFDANIASRLGLPDDTELMNVERLVTADGKAAIYCQDYFPRRLIKDTSYTDEDFKQPIFYFLGKYCQVETFMDLTTVSACSADPRLAELLSLPLGSPLLYMDEIDYDVTGRPILYSEQYYADGVIEHTVLRKKI